MARFVPLLFVLLGALTLAQAYNKYSKEANKNLASTERPFRMQKLNLLWEKASKKLDAKILRKLYDDLKSQDKDELLLKKLKGENQDREGLKEAQIRKQLNMLLRKYGLDLTESTVSSVESTSKPSQEAEKPLFKDKKLDKLWKKAQKADFSEPQLKILKEELRHYEEKVEQYHQIVSELHHRTDEQQSRERQENHIDAFLESEEPSKDSKAEQTSDKLKQKHVELKDEYRRLSDMVYNVSVNGDSLKGGEFEEDQAAKLWNLALKSDFTDEELDSLRDELLHFQKRIKKLRFFEAQIEADKMAGKREWNEPQTDQAGEHKHVARKVKELNYKVDKMHSELENRILQRHSEL